MEILDQHAQPSPLAAARHIGLSWAMIGLIRAFPYHARVKRLYLPAALLDAAQVDRRTLFATATAPGLSTVIQQLVATAENHLAGARALRPEIAKQARSGLLVATLTTAYIGAIKRTGHEPRDLPATAPGRPVRLLFATLRRRY